VHFEDAGMPHKMDKLLTAAGLPTDIDAIPDSTSDSETAPTPCTPHPSHFPYENTDFTSILDNVSTVYLDINDLNCINNVILMT
jgi:hypothetical protein